MLDYTRDILPYLEGTGPRHAYYEASKAHRDRIRQVFRRSYPVYLDLNRPKESTASKNYRKVVYKNPFRSLRSRYIDTLGYIPQADDFAVVFPAQEETQTDTLENYCSSGFSADGTLDEWFWRRVRPLYVHDPNAVLLVLPLQQPGSDMERVAPTAVLIPCDGVWQHKKGRFAVLELPQRKDEPKRLAFVDHDSYAIATLVAKEINPATSLPTYSWAVTGIGINEEGQPIWRPALHGCPKMPAMKLGKLQEEEAEKINAKGAYESVSASNTAGIDPDEEYYESSLSPALAHIETAQQIESDLAVERNLHVSSQEWRYTTKGCPDEKKGGDDQCIGGTKVIRDANGDLKDVIVCPTCKGHSNNLSMSGTEIIGVTPPSATSFADESRPSNLPIPPGGFIPRNIDALNAFVKEYERVKAEAYAVIDMQFLETTPTTASGTSKRYDREELYRKLNTEAAHLCTIERFAFSWVGYQRFGASVTLPVVIEPIRFSLENAELTREELVEAVDKSFDSNLRKPLEKKLISYQSGEDSNYYRRYELREQLDPYPGVNNEEKLFILSAQRITLEAGSEALQLTTEEVWLSILFDGLLNEQLRTMGEAFWSLKLDVQYTKLLEAARKRVGKIAGPVLDPVTGKPMVGGMTLTPLVDVKNADQLS
ncbi:hypothetical protein [Fibrivirga algicola]|uniref:Phage portal protein n=1 Tax=Fibrivirga algicola TaxID=2950420 RepID=A0ABX0QBU0_9BACT|nr:hypothetical protein [Fibrivirga algicola]NID09368.1 hypothetical protein [Fibrivirga algicola]